MSVPEPDPKASPLLPGALGSLPPSPRSPRVIVLAAYVDGLVHVALGSGPFARALHRGGRRRLRGAAAASPPPSRLLPARPPWALRQTRLPRRRRRRAQLLAALSHACSPARPPELAPATPPPSPRGRGHLATGPRLPRDGVALWLAQASGGGASPSNARPEARAVAWERGRGHRAPGAARRSS